MRNDHESGKGKAIGLLVLSLFTLALLYNALFSLSYSVGPNYRNVSIDTRVNITNAKPEILLVTVTDPITLNAGSTKYVECNATIRDWNGGNTITNVSASLWDNNTVTQADPDDNNNHYTNSSCTSTSVNGYYANFTCGFYLYYYANNGSNWVCNVTVVDSYAFNASVGSNDSAFNTTTVNALLALNVTPLIDYGDMAVGDTSGPEEANVTNIGNLAINVSVKGYGSAPGDGLAFVCQIGNISISNEKYSLNASGDFLLDYTALSSTFAQIANLTLSQQTNDTQQVVNSTYWRLYVPPNPFGICNGTIVFQAESST